MFVEPQDFNEQKAEASEFENGQRFVMESVTDAQGNFSMLAPKDHFVFDGSFWAIRKSKAAGSLRMNCVWSYLQKNLEITLADETAEVRVLDPNGNPLVGASVQPEAFRKPKSVTNRLPTLIQEKLSAETTDAGTVAIALVEISTEKFLCRFIRSRSIAFSGRRFTGFAGHARDHGANAMNHPHVAWGGPVIELQNVSRYFGTTHAVDDVSFSVPRGTVFGYIGPNGAGKTTSMRILSTLEIPNHGDARIEGLSSVNDPDRVRTRLGFMPDAFGTYRNTNCAEYLDFYARSHGLVGRQRTARMRWVMDFTGLRSLAEKPIRGLSKGMRQRLCLGRALIHDHSVLILDEPAAGLDPRARIELRRIIRTLAADGKTILVSSHILTELAEMCDRVGIIEQGRLLAPDRSMRFAAMRQPTATSVSKSSSRRG